MTCDDSPCREAVFFTAQDFLDLFDRIFPREYLAPLQSPGPGFELFEGYAKLYERLSLAVARLDCGAHILQASGARFSVTQVAFSRPDVTPVWPAPGSVTIKAGTIVRTENGRRRFATTQDAFFGVADLVSTPALVNAIALVPAYEYNVPGERTTATGVILEGEISFIEKLVTSPLFSNTLQPNFVVGQPPDATCGRPPMLDSLGADRGLPRNPGEGDEAYRQRIRTLPDTVTPDAIVRSVLNYLSIFCGGTLTFDFIETWQLSYQTCFDCPSPNPGTPTFLATIPASINTNLFTYDDPRPAYPPFRNRWLSEEDYRGAFIIVVPNLDAVSDLGFAYDDTSMVPGDLLTACGFRSVGAYDVPSDYSASSAGFYDGGDTGKAAIYKGLFDMLERIKVAGVFEALELQGE